MTKHLVRLLSVFFGVSLCATMTVSAYAQNGPKEKAHVLFTSYFNAAWIGGPDIVSQSFASATFEYPDKGYFDYLSFDETYNGSWMHMEVEKLSFGTYSGAYLPDGADPIPAVYFLGKILGGEDFVAHDAAEILGVPEHQNYEGYYKVGAFVDGTTIYGEDMGMHAIPIPPEGLPAWCDFFGVCGTGEEQAQQLFESLKNGEAEIMPNMITKGDIKITLK